MFKDYEGGLSEKDMEFKASSDSARNFETEEKENKFEVEVLESDWIEGAAK